MTAKQLVHTKRLCAKMIRELTVYYDRGSMNYWDNSAKPKGIYMASGVYGHVEGTQLKTWTTEQKGDGYMLIVPLKNYSAKQLRLVTERTAEHAERIHTLLENGGNIDTIKALLRGKNETADGAARDLSAEVK